jgi:hypothetical protein
VTHLPATGSLTNSQVLQWAEVNRVALEDCAQRMDKIRALQTAPKAPVP